MRQNNIEEVLSIIKNNMNDFVSNYNIKCCKFSVKAPGYKVWETCVHGK